MARSGIRGLLELPETVSVPERGEAHVPTSTWTRLESSEGFRRLLERGILSARLLPGRRVRLHGSAYVGRAQFGDMTLELQEKVPGALAALLGHATRDAFRVERAQAPASGLGHLAVLLIRQFLTSVAAYASRGRGFHYTVERWTGSLVGGKLDIARSVKLRARGLGHLLVFEKNAITYGTPVNRILLAALREVELASSLLPLQSEDIVRARGLAMLFADCRDAEILFSSRAALVDRARALMDEPHSEPVRDMIALASVVLARESFEPSEPGTAVVPRAWFLNLETLFEAAVRHVLADTVQPIRDVTRGGEHGRKVFQSRAGQYTAHPDLVVSRGDVVEAIGDVKYKTWDGSPTASDVYQLLVHAAAFGSRRAFLVFPSDQFEIRDLGEAVTGCTVTFFAVDIRDLSTGLAALAAHLGMADPLRP